MLLRTVILNTLYYIYCTVHILVHIFHFLRPCDRRRSGLRDRLETEVRGAISGVNTIEAVAAIPNAPASVRREHMVAVKEVDGWVRPAGLRGR